MKKPNTKKITALFSAAVLCAGVASFALPACSNKDERLLVEYSFEETEGNKTLNGANGKQYKIDYVFNSENQAVLYKPASDPLLKQGVSGKSLYMDGFSVCIENEDFVMPKKEITLSAWVAPRVFEDLGNYGGDAEGYKRLTTVLGQSSLEIAEGFSFGYGAQGLWGVEFAITNEAGNDVVWGFYDPVNTLKLYEWTHIAVSIDLNEGYLALAYNGEISYQTVMSEIALSNFVGSMEEPLYMGYTVAQQDENGVKTQMPAGLVDEVKIYSASLSPSELKGIYAEGAANGVHPTLDWKEVAIDSSQYEGDRYRAQFHALPPGVWMNEPHAPFYFNGKYHVFYQHNPAGPRFTGSMMRWGHIVSDDMVHWQYVKDAVVPQGVCSKGVWTGGSVIGPDGTPWLLLTAGSIPGNSGSGQNIAYAHPADPTDPYLTDWVVEDKVAIAQAPDNTQGQINEFRDSTCWKEGDTYYLTVSSSNPNAGGAIPMFTSKDMRNWEYRGYLYENASPDLGIHWECAAMLPVSNGTESKYVLMVIPQFSDNSSTSIDTYYWLGTFDKLACRFIPDEEYKDSLHKFDFGNGHFNGQAGFYDEIKDRTVLYGIMQGTDAESTVNSGWAHNFAFPLEISLSEDGKSLVRKPIEEIETLYGETLYDLSSGSKTAGLINEEIKDIRGDMLRIDATVKVNGSGDYNGGIAVRYNPYSTTEKTEQTKIVFGGKGVYVDRSQSSVTVGLEKGNSAVWGNVKDEYSVIILLDRSTLEVYVDGLMSFTTRIYPEYGDSDYLRLFEENCLLTFTRFTVRRMKGAYKDEVTPAYYGNKGLLQEAVK
ncbi:MAG: GH32 C-terminal domain-containing protein [Clostridia bacterium]|nr:GH32 C-terminal domain-containing protein [Clostridia bacterium]